jgi:uroporphyrinogen-III synthase
MQQNKITILSTRPLANAIIRIATEKNIVIETISLIETEPIITEEVKENIIDLLKQPQVAVFTSMNAVEAVAAYLSAAKTNWKIFCIGSTTKKLVKGYFGENAIAGTADSASALADVIINEKNISSVTFLCGDKRRDELPEKLRNHKIEVNELVVYKTFEKAQTISKQYDAVLFYSPSAVNSFFSVNEPNHQAILFAIGNTTANEIKKFSNNKIIIGKEPVKELLAEQAISYFQANPIHH